MQISAKADYAVRALLELAQRGQPATAETLAEAQQLPRKFAALILSDLRRAGLLTSRRGHGGYQLARPPQEITVADILQVIDGFLLEVDGHLPDRITYVGAATHLQKVWHATQAALREVLGTVTLDQIAMGQLPEAEATAEAEVQVRPAARRPQPGVDGRPG